VTRARLDTNVYVPALQLGGLPMRLLGLAVDGDMEVAISRPIMDEMVRVLRERFHWSPERLGEAEALIRGIAYRVSPSQTLNVVAEDPDDVRTLECAVEPGSQYIVTDETHLFLAPELYARAKCQGAEVIDVVHRTG
jgi:putative PIN family toxin of toxin-antitoxin system